MPFTTITADTALNDLDLALEISTALNKRCAVAGVTGITVPDVGTNVRTFIRACQEKIQAVSPSFSNPSATLAGQSALPSSWTLSAAMTAAGLTASGYWRRIPAAGSLPAAWSSYSDAAYNYGLAAENDIIGPWLFADLMAVLSKLTRHASDPLNNDVDYHAYQENIPDSQGSEFELSGTVTLTAVAGSGKVAHVLVSKTKSASLHTIWGSVSAMRLRLPRNDISGATETRTIVYKPTMSGSVPFTAITGFSAEEYGLTKTASPAELETGYAVLWLWGTASSINGLNVLWASLSSLIDWSTVGMEEFESVWVSDSAACLVTDYDMGDGATS